MGRDMEPADRPLMFPDYGPGTCINCGFLAFSISSEFTEAHLISLRRRAYPYDPDAFVKALPGWWHCFVYAANLRSEMVELEEQGIPGHERQAQIIQKGRECQEFYTGVPGFDPRWHFQDREKMRLEELRRQNDLKIAELDQRSQESMREIMEAHKEITERLAATVSDQAGVSARQESSNRRFNFLFVVIGVIAIVLALSPLVYPDGIDWIVDRAPGAVNNQAIMEVAPTLAPSPSAVELTPTPSPESTPGMALPQPRSAP